MPWLSPPQLKGIKFHSCPSNRIPPKFDGQLDDLYRESLHIDFPERTEQEVDYRVARLRHSRKHLNPDLKTRLLSDHSVYSHSRSILGILNGKAILHLPIADNASASRKRPGLLGTPERSIKLHVTGSPEQGDAPIKHRYMWLGQVGMNRLAHALIMNAPPDEINLLDVGVYLASQHFHAAQPVRTYPWHGPGAEEGEDLWEIWNKQTGMQRVPGSDKYLAPFGSSGVEVHQIALGGLTVAGMRLNIERKSNAEELAQFRQHFTVGA